MKTAEQIRIEARYGPRPMYRADISLAEWSRTIEQEVKDMKAMIDTGIERPGDRAKAYQKALQSIQFPPEDEAARTLFNLLYEEVFTMMPDYNKLLEAIENQQERTMQQNFDRVFVRLDDLDDRFDEIGEPEVVYRRETEGDVARFTAGFLLGAVGLLAFIQLQGLTTAAAVFERAVAVIGGLFQ